MKERLGKADSMITTPGDLVMTQGYCAPSKVLKWMGRLRNDDQANVKRLVKGLFDWSGQICRASEGARISLSAVGSTLKSSTGQSYGDIDFLMLFNRPLNNILPESSRNYLSDLNNLLYENLDSHHASFVDISGDFCNDAYGEKISEPYKAERGLISVVATGRNYTTRITDASGRSIRSPLSGHWHKVHVIVQGNVASEEDWDETDRYARLPIYVVGN